MLTRLRSMASYILAPKELKAAVKSNIGEMLFAPMVAGGTLPRAGTRELLAAYSDMPWLRAVTSKVGRSVGNTTWRLFAATNGSSSDSRAIRNPKIQRASYSTRKKLLSKLASNKNLREIEDHPLLDLLNTGNPDMLGISVMQTTQIHIDLAGEAFWMLERNGVGMPIAIWPLPPDWVREFPSKSRPTYIIRVTQQDIEVPKTEIISFIDPNPSNPYARGTGIARALGDELETDEYAAKHLKNFFFNRARPDMIISGDGLRREATERLEERWLEKHQGFWNAYKPHFLSQKVDIKELGQHFENMQMIQIRKFERDTVIQVFGVPPEKLGIVNESKRSTIVAADLFWSKDVILPRVEFLRAVMQDSLVPLFDDRLILDFDSPIVQDKELELGIMKVAPWAFSKNEWRDFAGAEDMGPDGDIFVQQGSLAMVNPDGTPFVEEEEEEPEDEGTPTPDPDNDDDEDADAVAAAIHSNLQKALPAIQKAATLKVRAMLNSR